MVYNRYVFDIHNKDLNGSPLQIILHYRVYRTYITSDQTYNAIRKVSLRLSWIIVTEFCTIYRWSE